MSSAIPPAAPSRKSWRSSIRSVSPASSIAASWTKADAYFRRLFAPAQGDAAAPWAGDLCAGEHAAALSRPTISPATTRSCASSRRSRLPLSPRPRRVHEPDRRDPGFRPHRRTRPHPHAHPRSSRRRTIWSRRPISPRSWRAAFPGAEAKFFAQGGHYFTQVMPREFNQAVLPFLAAHTPAEARSLPVSPCCLIVPKAFRP